MTRRQAFLNWNIPQRTTIEEEKRGLEAFP
jgi:hypothetical protein